jgi:hypothetical protein
MLQLLCIDLDLTATEAPLGGENNFIQQPDTDFLLAIC